MLHTERWGCSVLHGKLYNCQTKGTSVWLQKPHSTGLEGGEFTLLLKLSKVSDSRKLQPNKKPRGVRELKIDRNLRGMDTQVLQALTAGGVACPHQWQTPYSPTQLQAQSQSRHLLCTFAVLTRSLPSLTQTPNTTHDLEECGRKWFPFSGYQCRFLSLHLPAAEKRSILTGSVRISSGYQHWPYCHLLPATNL